MSTNKHFDAICLIVIVFAVGLTVAFMNGERLGLKTAQAASGYESRLFDTSRVHEINIVMNDFDELCARQGKNTWYDCTAVIDGEKFSNLSIRVKGNAGEIESRGSIKYSYKIAFDHTNKLESYHGLDELSLNNFDGDCTYMKDFTVYEMMAEAGVPAPLASYTYLTVNGEDVGLYLAVESIEDAFLVRNFGRNTGYLYKPSCDDAVYRLGQSIVGEPASGDGTESVIEQIDEKTADSGAAQADEYTGRDVTFANHLDHIDPDVLGGSAMAQAASQRPEESEEQTDGSVDEKPEGIAVVRPGDIKLIYIDDDPESYPNIFAHSGQEVTDRSRKRLINALKTLNSEETATKAVDIDEVIAYFAVHNFVVSFNSYTGESADNYYLYEKDGKLSMLPWDYSSAFGTYRTQDSGRMVNYPIDTPLVRGISGERPMFDWIMKDQRYVTAYHAVLGETASSFRENSISFSRIRKIEEMLTPYIVRDPNKFSSETAFHKGVATLTAFLEKRARSVESQLNGEIPSTFDGQTDALSSLIDASDIELIDMK